MHHVVALISERQGGTCTNLPLSQVLIVMCLMSKDRGNVVYILLSSDPTLALLLLGFTEYDDDDEFSLPSDDASVLYPFSLTPLMILWMCSKVCWKMPSQLSKYTNT
ncbi:hypothetical protein Hanom_Chr12g01131481 [Helianthus anomalus]